MREDDMTDRPPVLPFQRDDPVDLSPTMKRLRASGPVRPVQMPSGEPAWMVTGRTECREVLGDARYSCALGTALPDNHQFIPFVNRFRTLLSLDPPEHAWSRSPISRLLSASAVEPLKPGVNAVAEAAVRGLVDAGPPADLVSGFATPFAGAVMEFVTGVDRNSLVRLGELFSVVANIDRYPRDVIQRGLDDLAELLDELIATRRSRADDDLLGHVVRALDDDPRTSHADVVGAVLTLLIAGATTPGSVIAGGVTMLLRDRPQWQALTTGEPALLGRAVEEVLRFCPAVEFEHLRVTREPVVLGGRTLPAGARVLTSIAAANRDPDVFDEPDVFDTSRERNPHLAFGYGPHACPGSALARLTIGAALRALVGTLPGLTLLPPVPPGPAPGGQSHSVGPESLLVTW